MRNGYRMTGEPELVRNILSNLSLKEQTRLSRTSQDFRDVQRRFLLEIIRKKFLTDYLLAPTYLGNVETRADNEFDEQMDTLKTFGRVRSITIPSIRNYDEDKEDEWELKNEWLRHVVSTTEKQLSTLLDNQVFISNVISLVNKTVLDKNSPEFQAVKRMLASDVDTDGEILLEIIRHIKDA